MDTTDKVLQTKRFVIEDSVTKVSLDGEPHKLITIIAGVSGIAVAVVILIVLAAMTEWKLRRRSNNNNNNNNSQTTTDVEAQNEIQAKKIPIILIDKEPTPSMSTISGSISSSVAENSDASPRFPRVCTCDGKKIGKECLEAISVGGRSTSSKNSSISSIPDANKLQTTSKINHGFINEEPSTSSSDLEKMQLKELTQGRWVEQEKRVSEETDSSLSATEKENNYSLQVKSVKRVKSKRSNREMALKEIQQDLQIKNSKKITDEVSSSSDNGSGKRSLRRTLNKTLDNQTKETEKRTHWSDQNDKPLQIFHKSADKNIEIEKL